MRKPCGYPRCPAFIDSGSFCDTHRPHMAPIATADDHERKLTYSRAPWRKTRERILAERPVCEICKVAFSAEVHHVIRKAAGGEDDDANLQALCKPCHSRLTAKGE